MSTLFQVGGFLLTLAGVGALLGWPVAAILGGATMFVTGGIAAAREAGRR